MLKWKTFLKKKWTFFNKKVKAGQDWLVSKYTSEAWVHTLTYLCKYLTARIRPDYELYAQPGIEKSISFVNFAL